LVTLGQSFTPYGEVLETYGQGQTDYAFTGEMYDPQTGLVFLRTRYYAPRDGRFFQLDTIVPDPRSTWEWNSYVYSQNNPINLTDPSGKSPQPNSEILACISSSKLNGVTQGMKESICKMIEELEDAGYLKEMPNENHIPEDGGFRTTQTAHRWSTTYHILHDFVTIEDLRKTPVDTDGNIWYKEEWDSFYCLSQSELVEPSYYRSIWLGYVDFLVKKNASNNASEIHLGGRISGYLYTAFGRIRDVTYALEGYMATDSRRLPNTPHAEVTRHVSGLAVDVSIGILLDDIWKQVAYTEIDRIAHNNRLKRPLNTNNYVEYTDDENPEWWHFEPYGR